MCATSSMSAEPSAYQGSITQSWPKRDVDAGRHQLRHARHAAPLRIGVVAALQRDVDQRIGDRCDAAPRRSAAAASRRSSCPSSASRCRCEPVDAALQAEALRLVGQRLDVARQRIVGLVAMHVDQQAALGGDLAQHASRSRRRRPWCARNAGCRRRRRRPCRARASGCRARRRRAQQAVLREGDELQVEIGRDALASLRAAPRPPAGASSQMSTWLRIASRPLRHRPVAIAQRALDDRLVRRAAASARPTARCLRAACRSALTRGRP